MNNTQRKKKESELRMHMREALDRFFYEDLDFDQRAEVLLQTSGSEKTLRVIWQGQTLLEKLEILTSYLIKK